MRLTVRRRGPQASGLGHGSRFSDGAVGGPSREVGTGDGNSAGQYPPCRSASAYAGNAGNAWNLNFNNGNDNANNRNNNNQARLVRGGG